MYTISREYTFDATHRLEGHRGKCSRIHGHTFVVVVSLSGPQVSNVVGASDRGMLLDFGDLDEVVKPLVERLDHHFIASENSRGCKESLTAIPGDVVFIDVERTTSELLARWLWDQIVPKLSSRIRSLEVTVKETPKSTVTYTFPLWTWTKESSTDDDQAIAHLGPA